VDGRALISGRCAVCPLLCLSGRDKEGFRVPFQAAFEILPAELCSAQRLLQHRGLSDLVRLAHCYHRVYIDHRA
jgi:hypothetical protein